jgi:arylsulfatase A-like enzyme
MGNAVVLNRLSPIWGVVLGFWIPVAFLRNVDGYWHVQRWYEIVFTYATGWTVNAVWVAAFCVLYLLLWALPRLHARGDRAFDLTTVTIGRTLFLVALASMMAEWVGVRGRGMRALPGQEWSLALAFVVAVAATIRTPTPGPLLSLSRRVGKWSTVALPLVLLSATLEWRDTHGADDPLPASREAHPDVVLITVDTLSAARMSLYGHSRPTTPRLEALAATATVFDRSYANANYTTPATSSQMLGVRPWTHRSLQLFSRPLDGPLEHNLLRKFDESGYRVMTVDTNSHAAPMQQRLRRWVDDDAWGQVESLSYRSLHLGRWIPQFGYSSGMGFTVVVIHGLESLLVRMGFLPRTSPFDPALPFAQARRLWQSEAEGPRFLWVHTYGPHEPYAATPEFLGRFDPGPERRTRFDSMPPYLFAATGREDFPDLWTGRYDEAVLMSDHHIGEFLDWLRSRGDLDGAVVVISADHGESFGHGYGGHGGPMMWEDLVRIPLIIKQPGQTTGRRNATVVEQVDLAPTLLSLAGLPPEPAYEGEAIPLDASVTGRDAWTMNLEQSQRFETLSKGTMVLIEDRWKYIHHFGQQRYPRMPELSDGLFDLSADPGELTNLAGQQAAVAARMKAAIEAALEKHRNVVH